MVASTMAYSMSGSSETASNNRFPITRSIQSRKRCVHAVPVAERGSGRSRHGLPVRAIQQPASDKQPVVLAATAGIARLAKTKRLHLRPLGVSQNEWSIHSLNHSQALG